MEGCETAGGRWPLLPLNEVPEEPGDLRPGDVELPGWRSVLGLKFPEAESGLDDEGSYLFEQYDNDGHLSEDGCAVKAADLGFVEDGEVFLGRGVGSLGSGPKGLELLVALGSADDLGDEPGVGLDRHVFCEAVVVDPVRAIPRESHKIWIAGFHTLSSTGEGCPC